MTDPLLDVARNHWDDPYESAMRTLGACCDLLTLIDGDLTGHRIPPEVGYRPAAGFNLRAAIVDRDAEGFEYDWQFEDGVIADLADALNFELSHNGEEDEPELFASATDWNRAPELLLTTINSLHTYIEVCRNTGMAAD